MAWIDDRIWCHPKLANVSHRAFRAYVNGIAYSSGMGLKGHLTPQQQRLMGATPRVCTELIEAGLWNRNGDGICINDWDFYNEKRDARREADRERKRIARAKERELSPDVSAGLSAGPAHVEGSEGSDGSEGRTKPTVEGQARRVEIFTGALRSAADRKVFESYPQREQSQIAQAWSSATGWRYVRGTHGDGYKSDPLGSDRNPTLSDNKPTAQDFLAAWTAKARQGVAA